MSSQEYLLLLFESHLIILLALQPRPSVNELTVIRFPKIKEVPIKPKLPFVCDLGVDAGFFWSRVGEDKVLRLYFSHANILTSAADARYQCVNTQTCDDLVDG